MPYAARVRVSFWILGAEVLAFDVGRSPVHEHEDAAGAGTGGQFEIGFQGSDVDAQRAARKIDDVLAKLREIKQRDGLA